MTPESLESAYRITAAIVAAGYAIVLIWAIYKIDREKR